MFIELLHPNSSVALGGPGGDGLTGEMGNAEAVAVSAAFIDFSTTFAVVMT